MGWTYREKEWKEWKDENIWDDKWKGRDGEGWRGEENGRRFKTMDSGVKEKWLMGNKEIENGALWRLYIFTYTEVLKIPKQITSLTSQTST